MIARRVQMGRSERAARSSVSRLWRTGSGGGREGGDVGTVGVSKGT